MNIATFAETILNSVQVGGTLEMDNSVFNDKLIMEKLTVASTLFLRNCKAGNTLEMIFARIGGSFDISSSSLQSVDLTGTKIKEEFCLGSEVNHPTKWEKESILRLRNTEVGTLQDLQNAWPDELELVGFTYSQLGGFATDERVSMYKRDIPWMKKWLERQKNYSPQPYKQLGKVLSEAGYKNKANDILFKGKMRELKESWKTKCRLTSMGLFLQLIFVGFGYSYLYTLWWVIALFFIGEFVLLSTGQGLANGMPWGFSYSLDMLLPAIRLNESHYAIKLVGFAKYYFYVHIVLGYVLASYLIAGLSGITKK
jgi:hypothetical protein